MKTTKLAATAMAKVLVPLALLALCVPAQAGIIETDEVIAAQSRQADSAKVMQFLAREDVVDQMEALGVAPELAQERVAMLSDEELQHLSQRIEADPAGAGAIEILGVTFLVLLILEFVGVINIFSG